MKKDILAPQLTIRLFISQSMIFVGKDGKTLIYLGQNEGNLSFLVPDNFSIKEGPCFLHCLLIDGLWVVRDYEIAKVTISSEQAASIIRQAPTSTAKRAKAPPTVTTVSSAPPSLASIPKAIVKNTIPNTPAPLLVRPAPKESTKSKGSVMPPWVPVSANPSSSANKAPTSTQKTKGGFTSSSVNQLLGSEEATSTRKPYIPQTKGDPMVEDDDDVILF